MFLQLQTRHGFIIDIFTSNMYKSYRITLKGKHLCDGGHQTEASNLTASIWQSPSLLPTLSVLVSLVRGGIMKLMVNVSKATRKQKHQHVTGSLSLGNVNIGIFKIRLLSIFISKLQILK